jgi:uncharacterized membrane protein YfcA
VIESTEIIGYSAALIIGIVLGLIGGGGSILTVPVLVYLLAIEPLMATAYSLFIVGAAALVGAIRNMQKGLVDLRTGVVFSIPAFIAVYLTRRFMMPAIPEHIAELGGVAITRDLFIMVLFGVIMLFAAISMIRERKALVEKEEERKFMYPMILLEGAVVGVLTGIVGAGGGFLIIPALVVFSRLPMKLAVGTSLMIIAVKSLIGFLGDVQNMAIDWTFLLIFTGIAAIGILLGIYATNFIEGKKLKKAFGYFTLVMAIYILWKELF